MPTVLRITRYRFFFFSADRNEPPHIHIEAAENTAKFWLNPVWLARSEGFNNRELNQLQKMVEDHEQELLEAWYEFFND